MGFHRLKIIDTSDDGNQPLIHKNIHLVANGEVYNYQSLMEEYKDKYTFQSESDCEVIIPMFHGTGMEETAAGWMLNLSVCCMMLMWTSIMQPGIRSESAPCFTAMHRWQNHVCQ